MNKKTEGVIIWIVLVGALFFALRLPFLVYGGAPEFHDDVLQPRYTATPLSVERAMTQQAFAMMFFTPTYTVEPTQPFLAFLLPITGATQTFTPTATITYTATFTATPTRTLLPVFMTQTRVSGGGGGPFPGPGLTPTKTPVVTLTTGVTSTANPTSSATDEPTLTLEPTAVPVDTATPVPTGTKPGKPPTKTEPPPTATDAPPPTATDAPPPTATDAPPPTATDAPPVPTETVASGGNSMPGDSSASSPYFLQFIMMYLMGGTFLGVVFRRR